MLIDTHCHLELIIEKLESTENFATKSQAAKKIVDEAQSVNVAIIITVGTTLATSTLIVEKFAIDPAVFCAIGLHPCDITSDWQEDMRQMELLFSSQNNKKIIGIGECGLDFYHPGFVPEQQKEVFRAHIQMSLQRNLPLIIHTRNAFDATITVIDEYKNQEPKGVFHCFSEDVARIKKVVDRGFFIGVGGTITYPKNVILRDAIKTVGIDHIVLETDAPFLPPQGFRGKINHPKHLTVIANFLADFFGVSYEQICEKTTENAKRLFRLQK